MPSEIERFEPSLMGTREDRADCVPDPDGEWVRYSDHLAALTSPPDRTGEPVAFQWETIDGWIECNISGGAEVRQRYAKNMAAKIGMGYRELYASPDVEQARLRERVAELEDQCGHWISENRRVLKAGQEALDRAEAAEAKVKELEELLATGANGRTLVAEARLTEVVEQCAKIGDIVANEQYYKVGYSQNTHTYSMIANGAREVAYRIRKSIEE